MKSFLRKNKLALWLGVIFAILFVGLIFSGLNYIKQHVINDHKEALKILANEKGSSG